MGQEYPSLIFVDRIKHCKLKNKQRNRRLQNHGGYHAPNSYKIVQYRVRRLFDQDKNLNINLNVLILWSELPHT